MSVLTVAAGRILEHPFLGLGAVATAATGSAVWLAAWAESVTPDTGTVWGELIRAVPAMVGLIVVVGMGLANAREVLRNHREERSETMALVTAQREDLKSLMDEQHNREAQHLEALTKSAEINATTIEVLRQIKDSMEILQRSCGEVHRRYGKDSTGQ